MKAPVPRPTLRLVDKVGLLTKSLIEKANRFFLLVCCYLLSNICYLINFLQGHIFENRLCQQLQSVPKCGHTPGKVAGQRATVKTEMNGFAPGLDRRPPFR